MSKHNCEDTVAHIYFYLDNEISWFKKTRIRRHLKKCPPCEGAFGFENNLKAIVREHLQAEPEPEVMDRLRTYLKEHESGFGG